MILGCSGKAAGANHGCHDKAQLIDGQVLLPDKHRPTTQCYFALSRRSFLPASCRDSACA
jgi:hypothetical protein